MFLVIMNIISAFGQQDTTTGFYDASKNWPQPFKQVDSTTRLYYAVKNDQNAFYFMIAAKDLPTQTRLLKNGFQLHIDPKGKKNHKFNLLFKPEKTPGHRGGRVKPSFELLKGEFNPATVEVELSGFSNLKNGTFSLKYLDTPKITLNWDTANVLFIEYKVPFTIINYIKTDKMLSWGVILPAPEFAQNNASGRPSGMPGGRPHGGGMPGGRGPGGGMPSGPPPGGEPPAGGFPPPSSSGSSNFADMMKEKAFWVKFNYQ